MGSRVGFIVRGLTLDVALDMSGCDVQVLEVAYEEGADPILLTLGDRQFRLAASSVFDSPTLAAKRAKDMRDSIVADAFMKLDFMQQRLDEARAQVQALAESTNFNHLEVTH